MRRALSGVLGVLILVGMAHAAATDTAKCAAAKQLAAGKKAMRKLKCYSKASKAGGSVDAGCLTKADEKFAQAVAKADAKGGCAIMGDTSSLEAVIDSCVSNIVQRTPITQCLQAGLLCPGVFDCCPGLNCVLDPVLFISVCQ
jgi:flagellin-like protein